MAMASRSSTTGTAVLCFLVVVSLFLAPSLFVAGTEAAAAYGAGAGAGRKMKQAAAGAVATKQDGYGYPATSSPAGYPAVPCCPHPPEGGRG
ncbi:uncharacterized protein LOC100275439 precursor [Zea mays]|uniref:Uncharacterized protein n=1 Tax=Zea mays TaxID=4577 RepID=B6STA8_MAIZE|nr:uncharacterized protein LOC100275439 precursor [Zea mays]ACG28091.1 hypothetical protein [Zea mays]AQK49991.1 hypothetical protein ZEAMMB73_Zm00001d049288 [Zea mays]|eukprot:NP_001142983.1 uncharacterized protein LOC100275439 precursor [Zea mays]